MEMKRRRLKYGTFSFLMAGVVFAALVLLYGGLNRHPWRWDSTANREQSLSPQTQKVLQTLKREVTISAFFRRGDDVDDVYIRRKVDDILKQYAHQGDSIHYALFDPDLQVEEALKYNITTDGTVVISAGGRRKDIYKSQLFDYSNTAEEQMPAFLGEELFTNALLNVTEEKQKAVCVLEGHGERPLTGPGPGGFSEAKLHLEKNNYQVQPFSLVTTHTIPKECNLLVILGPTKRVQPQEEKLIDDYLDKGTLLLMLEANTNPGLENTLKKLRVAVHDDIILDPERHFLLGPHYPSPILEEHLITHDLKELNPILSVARSLKIDEPAEGVAPLLKSSPTAWGETNFTDQGKPQYNPGSDTKGPLILGVAVGDQRPQAVVVGDSDFASNGLIQIPGNAELFLNMVSWLVGEQNKLVLGPSKTDFRSLSTTPGQARFIAYFSQGGYPLLVLVGGLVYWYRRKNR